MKELLSNEEIDSLLAMFRAESSGETAPVAEVSQFEDPHLDVESRSRVTSASVSPLDLLKPNRFGRDRLNLLERLFATAAKAAGTLLTERLRIDVSCDCIAVEQMRFSTWRRQFEGPVGVWSFASEPFQSPVVLTMTSGLVKGVVDRLLGGSGRSSQVHDLFTPAELAVAEAIAEPLFGRLLAVFQDVVPLRPEIEGRAGSLSTLQALAPNDVALSVYFQIGGEVLQGDVRLAIASSDLEPFLDRVAEGTGIVGVRESAQGGAAVAAALGAVPFDLSVVLGSTDLSLRALLGLRAGDVLRLDRIEGDLLEAQVEGVARLRGEVEKRGSARMFRIEEVLARARAAEFTGAQS